MQQPSLGWLTRLEDRLEGVGLRSSGGIARFAIWLAPHCAGMSNLLFGWRKLDSAFKSYAGPIEQSKY